MVEIEVTDEFAAWYKSLSDDDAQAVNRYVALLESQGVTLDFPYSSKLNGSKYNLRELRVQSRGQAAATDLCVRPTAQRRDPRRRR